MRRENQWNNIKNYSGHLKRLIKIRHHSNSKDIIEPLNESLSQSKHKSVKSRRYLTQQTLNKQQSNIVSNRLPLTLPLVGLTQRQLLSKSLSIKKIPPRQAQIVLQNYLLSKRLLKAKPSINKMIQERDYQKHEKFSLLRSKSKLEEIKLSQSRLLKFKEFERNHRRKIQSRLSSTLGTGKYLFTIKINSLKRVNKRQDKNMLFNLILKIGKRSFTFQHISLRSLYESRSFHFRKRDLKFPNLLFGEFDEIMQTDCKKLGNFSIDLNEVYEKLNTLKKYEQFKFEKVNEVEGIRSIRSQLLIGTLSFNYTITKEKA